MYTMISLEWISALVSLDLQWFVQLAMDNLLWVFIFSVVIFIYNKMKFSFRLFAIVSLAWISYIEFSEQIGIVALAGGFVFIYYVGQLVILNLTNTISSLKDRIPFVLNVYFFALLAFYNFFLK